MRGTVSLKLPKVGVSLSMKNGVTQLGCPHCKRILFHGVVSPHRSTMIRIEQHMKACDTGGQDVEND